MNRWISREGRSTRGQSLVEFAVLLPFVLMLIVNVVNFGGFFYAWISVCNAARAGADYAIMGAATVTAPQAPPAANVRSLVTNDLNTLPNSASLQVRVCKNNNGTVSCDGTGTATIAGDPESAYYVSAMVEITYTYVPFVPLWNLPLGIHTTIPPTTVHRTALMRMGG